MISSLLFVYIIGLSLSITICKHVYINTLLFVVQDAIRVHHVCFMTQPLLVTMVQHTILKVLETGVLDGL